MLINVEERLDALLNLYSRYNGDKHDMFVGLMGLTAYDSGLNKEFSNSGVNKQIATNIIEIVNVIFEKKIFEYIVDYHNYRKFIIVAHLFKDRGWLDFENSMLDAHFKENCSGSAPITCAWVLTEMRIPYSIDNLKAVVKYMEDN